MSELWSMRHAPRKLGLRAHPESGLGESPFGPLPRGAGLAQAMADAAVPVTHSHVVLKLLRIEPNADNNSSTVSSGSPNA